MLPRAPAALPALLAALLGAAAAAPGGWYSGEHGPFRWTFRESRHLPFGPFGLGEEQHRRTFVWMGAAAAAPDVAMEALSGGAKRRLPMPTAWATVANVLYLETPARVGFASAVAVRHRWNVRPFRVKQLRGCNSRRALTW